VCGEGEGLTAQRGRTKLSSLTLSSLDQIHIVPSSVVAGRKIGLVEHPHRVTVHVDVDDDDEEGRMRMRRKKSFSVTAETPAEGETISFLSSQQGAGRGVEAGEAGEGVRLRATIYRESLQFHHILPRREEDCLRGEGRNEDGSSFISYSFFKLITKVKVSENDV